MMYCCKSIGGTGSPNWLLLSTGGVGSGDNGSTSIHTPSPVNMYIPCSGTSLRYVIYGVINPSGKKKQKKKTMIRNNYW